MARFHGGRERLFGNGMTNHELAAETSEVLRLAWEK